MEVGEERGEGENAAFWEGLRGAGGVNSSVSGCAVRLPGCSRNNKRRRDCSTVRRPLSSFGCDIRANAANPIDGGPIRVYPIEQKSKLPQPSSRVGWSRRCLPLRRFSEPG
ncbi:hypothetical protein LI328DRAFT_131734 [Trichoderma asperelloides]|nr:hypothetical protein LI328DRAFT_131734 [Trichoderma asperelloides]